MKTNYTTKLKVPFFAPWITKVDKKAILDALDATLLTDGPKLREFESAFARFTGAKYAIGVSNATAALQLSLKAIGVKKSDQVIIPDMTFVATANAVINNNATPILADISEDLNISTKDIERKITDKTKVILPVHFAGKSCNMKEIMKIAKKNNLAVIEDCAHAIGTKFNGKHVGLFGNVGCFSFYPTKNITTIEGGMVITNSKKIADYIKSSRNHGLTKSLQRRYEKGYPWEYDVIETGYNHRLDEIRSALGISQLKRISKLNSLRRKASRYYNSKLRLVEGIIVPEITNDDSCHLYIIRIQKKFGESRNSLYSRLLKSGIQTTVHYKPLHKFTIFRNNKDKNENYPNANIMYNEILSLPLYPQISRKEQDRVINCIIS